MDGLFTRFVLCLVVALVSVVLPLFYAFLFFAGTEICTLLFQHTWWRHLMETFSVLLALCAGNSPVTGEFPSQRPVTRSFDVFFDLRLNKRLSKQSRGWRFETQSRPLYRHSNCLKQHWIRRINKPHGLLVIADTTSIIKQTTNYVLTLCSILYIWELDKCSIFVMDGVQTRQYEAKPGKTGRNEGAPRQNGVPWFWNTLYAYTHIYFYI